MFLLFNLIFILAALALGSELGSAGIIYLVYTVFTFIPHLAVTIRRLHDVGRSGWFILILFIQIVGVIGLLAQAIKDGEPGPNQYGPNPKETEFKVVCS